MILKPQQRATVIRLNVKVLLQQITDWIFNDYMILNGSFSGFIEAICNIYKSRYPDEITQEKIPLNAVEREPVPNRVLNPNASEAS